MNGILRVRLSCEEIALELPTVEELVVLPDD
jgi:hypothetical protein